MLSSILMFLFACGSDPILDEVAERREEIKSGKNSSSSSSVPPQPKKVKPQDPPPQGKPIEPKPGNPQAPPQGKSKDPKPKDPQGEGPKVKIEGVISLENWSGNEIRIDIFDGNQRDLDGPRPKVISTKKLEKPGEFSLSLSKNEKGFWIGAYCDIDSDGKPGPKDPSGWFTGNPLQGDRDHSKIQIALTIPEEVAP